MLHFLRIDHFQRSVVSKIDDLLTLGKLDSSPLCGLRQQGAPLEIVSKV